MQRSLTVRFALMLSCTLGFGLAGCHGAPAADESPLAQRVADNNPQPVEATEVFDGSFVFSIDGMRKINGAL